MSRKIILTISDLKSMAKERNIKGYYRMDKVTLYRKLYNDMNEFDRFKLCWCMDDKTIGKTLKFL